MKNLIILEHICFYILKKYLKKINFFILNYFFSIFKSFWYAKIKNKFKKIKNYHFDIISN